MGNTNTIPKADNPLLTGSLAEFVSQMSGAKLSLSQVGEYWLTFIEHAVYAAAVMPIAGSEKKQHVASAANELLRVALSAAVLPWWARAVLPLVRALLAAIADGLIERTYRQLVAIQPLHGAQR